MTGEQDLSQFTLVVSIRRIVRFPMKNDKKVAFMSNNSEMSVQNYKKMTDFKRPTNDKKKAILPICKKKMANKYF